MSVPTFQEVLNQALENINADGIRQEAEQEIKEKGITDPKQALALRDKAEAKIQELCSKEVTRLMMEASN